MTERITEKTETYTGRELEIFDFSFIYYLALDCVIAEM